MALSPSSSGDSASSFVPSSLTPRNSSFPPLLPTPTLLPSPPPSPAPNFFTGEFFAISKAFLLSDISSSSSLVPKPHANAKISFNKFDQSTSTFSRVRYCTSCKSNIRGFDHHCPAFGNCIGQKNHHLFIALLTGFIIAESSYTMCSTKFIAKYAETQQIEAIPASSLVISTMLFCVLQLLWQVVFLIWHIYCICINIKTDEWINWRKYPEFQIIIEPEQGCPAPETRFTNPYDKGLFSNIIEFLKTKG